MIVDLIEDMTLLLHHNSREPSRVISTRCGRINKKAAN
jgi:hypothetical protein